MRQYNADYMISHSIDWFFKFRGAPCYAPSNGFPLPDVITVQTNRSFQDKIHSDILKSFDRSFVLESPSSACESIEWEAFKTGELPSLPYVKRIVDNPNMKVLSYLSVRNYRFLPGSVDYILMNEYKIQKPTEKQRWSFIRPFVAMARRGFICFYPYFTQTFELGPTYMLIGGPFGLDGVGETLADVLNSTLPEYQLPSYSWAYISDQKTIEYKRSTSAIDYTIFESNKGMDLQ